MAPSTKLRTSVTVDFRGQDYVTETMNRGNITVKRHYPVYRGLFLLYESIKHLSKCIKYSTI